MHNINKIYTKQIILNVWLTPIFSIQIYVIFVSAGHDLLIDSMTC
jgi:hypothetical protein